MQIIILFIWHKMFVTATICKYFCFSTINLDQPKTFSGPVKGQGMSVILPFLSAVIFPTLWEYLRSLGVPESNVYYLGLCISAVTITDMFMGLFIGRLLDKFSRVLPFILVLNIFQILGSGLYFFGISPTFILIRY